MAEAALSLLVFLIIAGLVVAVFVRIFFSLVRSLFGSGDWEEGQCRRAGHRHGRMREPYWMEAAICPNDKCRALNNPSARFCARCGQRLR
mgnify:CR=1 FL=1